MNTAREAFSPNQEKLKEKILPKLEPTRITAIGMIRETEFTPHARTKKGRP